MDLPKIRLKHLIRHLGFKITVYIAIGYASIVAISLIITFMVFLGIAHFKNTIEQQALKHSGYTVQIGSITSVINTNYTPEIIINNLKIQNPKNPIQVISLNKLKFAFSYSSIWHLAPILDNLVLDGSNLQIELFKNGNVSVNGFIINHAQKNKNPSKFNFEQLLLQQKYIALSNLNLGFLEDNNTLPQINFNNINLSLRKGIFDSHDLKINFSDNSANNPLDLNLSWEGNSLYRINTWEKATLKITSVIKKNSFIPSISEYIPSISMLENFNTENIVTANIKNGRLISLFANFDVNNLSLLIPHSLQKINFPKLGGSIKINLDAANHYVINANNLTVSTSSGYIFNNKSLRGSYLINHSGEISLTDTDLNNFNNIFKFIPNWNKIKISGSLNIIQFSWLGNVFSPSDIGLKANFSKISIISNNQYIPSLNNLSGSLELSRHKGHAHIFLQQSTLRYDYMFLAPYQFKTLDSEINWQESNEQIIFNLHKTAIRTTDFNGSVSGKYIYKKGSSGYLNLQADIDRVLTHKIGNYLPKVIGVPVLQWLNAGLIGGYGNNGHLDLDGNLDDFPFTHGHGIFYIDADIEKGQVLFAKGWPTLDNINGKFQIRNQKIIILAKTAMSSQNQLESVTVTIPDMTADKVNLIANGNALGQTSNFMHYLIHSPLNDLLGKFPEKVDAQGPGTMKIYLKVPLSNPTKTTVNGIYTFQNNALNINLPIPPLTQVNGELNFFESGVHIKDISANAFDSNIRLAAKTDNSGIMHFDVISNNLDYKKASNFYTPFLSRIISGKSPADIKFTLTSNGLNNLNLQSDLSGTKIDAPSPLGKMESQTTPFFLSLTPKADDGFKIKINYNNSLTGLATLNNSGNLVHGVIAIGVESVPEAIDNSSKVMVYLKTNDFYALQWMDAINKIVESSAAPSDVSDKKMTHNLGIKKETQNSPFPVEIILLTKNTFIGKSNFYALDASVLVKNNAILFNLNNALTSCLVKSSF